METCLYIAEGEIEKRFLTEIKQLGHIIPGKFRKYNLMQKRLKNSDDIMSRRYSRIICIIDSDLVADTQLDNLQYNINKLGIVSTNLNVLVQNKNFEDELARLMKVNNLLKVFKQKFDGRKDLKRFLAQKIVYDTYISYEDIKQYCKEYGEFKNLWNNRFSAYDAQDLFISGKDIMAGRL